MSDEEFTPANVGTIDLESGVRVYVNTDGEEVEGTSYVLDESDHPIIKGKPWICKKCDLDNNGVICGECKKMYNQADPDCTLKD